MNYSAAKLTEYPAESSSVNHSSPQQAAGYSGSRISSMDSQDLKKRKGELSSEQYDICFLKGTEPPFSGKYTDNHEAGVYECIVCKTALFSSAAKFDSGTGWPSFARVMESGNVDFQEDTSLGMVRTEVVCKTCGAHLGHIFEDLPRRARVKAGGPTSTGKRYCINSLALNFVAKK